MKSFIRGWVVQRASISMDICIPEYVVTYILYSVI